MKSTQAEFEPRGNLEGSIAPDSELDSKADRRETTAEEVSNRVAENDGVA